MGFMKQTVLNSFRDALMENSEKKKFPLEKIHLIQTEKKLAFWNIFHSKDTKYRYGFEITTTKL